MSSAPKYRDVIVIGAGLVGLSTAWFLQEYGARVTVLDRTGVAAGSSWGNAGWVSPSLVLPLPEPSVLRYGLRTLFDRDAAFSVPLRFDPQLWSFLLRFASHCTTAQWERAMRSYVEINQLALGAYDHLATAGVAAPPIGAPILAAFEHEGQARDLRHELDLLEGIGQSVSTTELTGDQARHLAPHLSERVRLVLQLNGQRFLDPGAFAQALATDIEKRNGSIETSVDVSTLSSEAGGVTVRSADGATRRADAVVLASGTWLNELGATLGVRRRVQAGRGYSFTVPSARPVTSPIYLPALRVACTPYRGGIRVAGTMEFRRAHDPVDPRRIDAIVRGAQPLLQGLDWDQVRDVWVGSRPVVADGLPLIGKGRLAHTYVAGGHGMWGVALGPISGQLLAESIMTGATPDALRDFDPLR